MSKIAAVVTAIVGLIPAATAAQPITPDMPPKGSIVGPEKFPEKGGPAIYKAVCQGCHMPDGAGAKGAAIYPALAKNPRLAAPAYPITLVLNGHGAMPNFKTMLDDQQIADVVTYIRTSFGNSYSSKVTSTQVKALRGG
jgi:mono/diheme cytochrome c family protein